MLQSLEHRTLRAPVYTDRKSVFFNAPRTTVAKKQCIGILSESNKYSPENACHIKRKKERKKKA